MNYLRIHDNLVAYARSVSSRDRLFRRNPYDPRLSHASLYVEIHHIIPRTLGGLDVAANLVELLPEEHLFIHMLRYRVWGQREDALAVRFMLNGYDTKGALINTRIALTRTIRMGYAWLRSNAQAIRETAGWQTPDGLRRISEARKGKMPAKDAITGQKLGMVPVDHPNVLSGQWVHHTKGRKVSAEERANRPPLKGQRNPNASGLSDQYLVDKGIEAFAEFGVILSWGRMLQLSKARGFAWIKSLKSRFDGKGHAGYYARIEAATGAIYNPIVSRKLTPKGHSLC